MLLPPAARQKRPAANMISLKFSTLFSLRRPHLFLFRKRVGNDSYFLSRFSEKESMAKKEEPEGISISPQTLVGIKAHETNPCAARLLILALCSSSCDADRRLSLHRRNRFGFLGSFPRCLKDLGESVLHNKFCWQYGFSVPMKLQHLSDLMPK